MHAPLCSPPKWCVDQELVQSATDAIQAHNRTMKAKLKEQPHSDQSMSMYIIHIICTQTPVGIQIAIYSAYNIIL